MIVITVQPITSLTNPPPNQASSSSALHCNAMQNHANAPHHLAIVECIKMQLVLSNVEQQMMHSVAVW